jgi:putative ABC transport system permease protein
VDSFNRELLLRLQQIPGAVTAGLTSFLPASNSNASETFMVEGYVPPKGAGLNLATPIVVHGDYFHTMGIPLLRGRFFTDADRANAQLVAIVNRKLAQHYWPGQDPLGRRFRIGTREMQTPWLTVVGEIGDVKLGSPDTDTKEQFYQPLEQLEMSIGSLASPSDLNGNGGYIVFRGALPPEKMENVLRATVRSIDQQLPLTQVSTMEQAISDTEAPRRFNTAVITGFAAAALLLAVLGIYSVIAFSVASRAQEMAIRMALGSQRSGIMRLVLVSGAKLACIGCAIGLLGAMAASGLLRSFLFDVSPLDPLVLTLAAIAVLLLALTASAVPAQRAASIDPMQSLRAE